MFLYDINSYLWDQHTSRTHSNRYKSENNPKIHSKETPSLLLSCPVCDLINIVISLQLMFRLDLKVPISVTVPACRTILLSIILTAGTQSTLDYDTTQIFSNRKTLIFPASSDWRDSNFLLSLASEYSFQYEIEL